MDINLRALILHHGHKLLIIDSSILKKIKVIHYYMIDHHLLPNFVYTLLYFHDKYSKDLSVNNHILQVCSSNFLTMHDLESIRFGKIMPTIQIILFFSHQTSTNSFGRKVKCIIPCHQQLLHQNILYHITIKKVLHFKFKFTVIQDVLRR